MWDKHLAKWGFGCMCMGCGGWVNWAICWVSGCTLFEEVQDSLAEPAVTGLQGVLDLPFAWICGLGGMSYLGVSSFHAGMAPTFTGMVEERLTLTSGLAGWVGVDPEGNLGQQCVASDYVHRGWGHWGGRAGHSMSPLRVFCHWEQLDSVKLRDVCMSKKRSLWQWVYECDWACAVYQMYCHGILSVVHTVLVCFRILPLLRFIAWMFISVLLTKHETSYSSGKIRQTSGLLFTFPFSSTGEEAQETSVSRGCCSLSTEDSVSHCSSAGISVPVYF